MVHTCTELIPGELPDELTVWVDVFTSGVLSVKSWDTNVARELFTVTVYSVETTELPAGYDISAATEGRDDAGMRTLALTIEATE